MRIPTATYRLQLNHQFGFQDVRAILGYLERLGVSDIYASPIFCATPKSMHGYDMTDPTRLNPELGTHADFELLLEDVRSREMGWVQDFVPNHMAYSRFNPWLMDVLEYGPSSPYYHFFDILWDHPDPDLHGRVLAPFLGETLESVIDSGQLKLHCDANRFFVEYYDHRFPISPVSVEAIMQGEPQGSAVERFLESIHSDPALFKKLMDKQFYCLSPWKTAAEKINYRRFFYINDLICLNIDRPEVFEAVHSTLGTWVEKGMVTGLRIDHLDGLKYPERYLHDLRQRFGKIYVVAEKILEKDETVPERWPLEGTTGYDFANYTTAVFCDQHHRDAFIEGYANFISTRTDYESLLFEQKKKVIADHMGGDVDNLVRFLQRTGEFCNQSPDATRLAEVLSHLVAAFGIYRTYRADHAPGHRDYLLNAVAQAKRRVPEQAELLERIAKVFLSSKKTEKDEEFIARFRQITGPAMAKGFEDTLLYQYFPLLSLNEVGSMPETFGISIQQYHAFNLARLQTPHTMNATSTHDTKRGEDVRARINVLSEMPQAWFEKVRTWHQMNQPYKSIVDGRPAPDCNDEYMLYQVMLGALPPDSEEHDDFCERLKAYSIKSLREAKVHSRWIEPNEGYEQATIRFVDTIFHDSENDPFWKDFLTFWVRIHEYGLIASCEQALLKMTCPGVPDFYQGTECWDLNLVDPDNRRPVDYKKRIDQLDRLIRHFADERPAALEWLYSHRDAGMMKLFVISQTLNLRKKNRPLFAEGDYVPLRTEGRFAEHVIAFARVWRDRFVLVVAPRLIGALAEPGCMPVGVDVWADTRICVPEALRRPGVEIYHEKPVELRDGVLVGEILDRFPAGLICDFDEIWHNRRH